ncbi:MAG: histidine kinase dimerization/phosphoacceptor domain -containing protein, partial [Balneolaceae bacterium]|nr:histidine kinase dimerization/phosphoacceptor domain -containing protein [Balneolaceae bacterium]
GDYAFLVDDPVYINGTFYGTITAGMDFSSRFNDIMQGLNEYHVNVADDKGVVFYSFGSSEGIDSFRDMSVSMSIEVGDANQSVWSVSIVPNYLFSEVNSFLTNNYILGLFILLSILLAFSFFLIQKSNEAEQTSKLANEQLRSLIDSAPIGIFVIDSKGNVVDFWNTAAEKMLGWKKDEVLGDFLPHVSSEYKEDFKRIIKDIKENEGVSKYEVTRKRKDGTERLFRLHVSKVIGEEEQMMVLLEDITKEKEYELKLKNSLDEKSILLAEVHHRVKNNLAIIVGLIELQNAEVNDEETRSKLFETKNRIYSISGVHELLYQTDNFAEISFTEYINELVNRLQQTYDDKKNPVTIDKEISGFSVNINQAIPLGLLLNELITNSYKHAFDGVEKPKIKLVLKEKNGLIEIIYEDNGEGFDIELFDKASSLGATIIKSSLSQLEAEYEIYSNPGFGMRFQFPVQLKGSNSNLKDDSA